MSLLSKADGQGIELRLIGGLSIKIHCDQNKELFDRPIPDIDLVGHYRERARIANALKSDGWQPAVMFNLVNPNRLLFHDQDGTHVDVFLDVFEMCHKLDFRDRIALDKPTLSPADLLATKLQIVELNEKDLKDMARLLRDHELSESDSLKDTINKSYLAGLCAGNWGIYRTFTGTIKRTLEFLTALQIDPNEKEPIIRKNHELLASIEEMPKSTKWKIRARIGEKRVWYNLPQTRALGQSN